MPKTILLTIDVEDWFQVENFKSYIPFSSWDSYELRVEKNVHRLLDLFDSINPTNSTNATNPITPTNPKNLQPVKHTDGISGTNLAGPTNQIKATFFILGWIAERLPNLVCEVSERGHEVASHGCNHELSNKMDLHALRNDLLQSKKHLEDIIGSQVYGYRAPSFSINNDVLALIQDCGYTYDSSYNSFALNKRYGTADLSESSKMGVAYKISDKLFEIPISNLEFNINNSKCPLPWGGGGYFRLIPLILFRHGVERILLEQDAYMFYMHPWEIDPGQPRVKNASPGYKFRHYINLNRTQNKLKKLIENFSFCRFDTCQGYLDFCT